MILTDPMRIGDAVDPVAEQFIRSLRAKPHPKVVELGTRRWDPDLVTHHEHWAPHAVEYVKVDVTDGPDVDVVADAHNLPGEWEGCFDAVIAVSVWEHLERPWAATIEAARVLRPGGLLLIVTHHTFPEHGYPEDFWRFTTGALQLLFHDAGLDVEQVGETFPVTITPEANVARWNPTAPAWLCVSGFASKSTQVVAW